jgi:Uma2 family endonuclease
MDSHTITCEPQLSDAEFFDLCLRFDDMNFEMTKEGTIRMMTPAGNDSSKANAEIIRQLGNWWHAQGKNGRVFDSNTLFKLPDGSQKGPDAAYITAERLAGVPREALRAFAPVVPSFVIELLSETDTLAEAQGKMADWMNNDVELGWLIDPYERASYVYAARQHFSTVSDKLHGIGPMTGFALDLTEVWRAYE